MIAPNPTELENLLIEKFKKLFGKGSDWSDDMYVAYTELLAEHPDREKELYAAYIKVSSQVLDSSRVPLDLAGEFDAVWWDKTKDCWVGQTDPDSQPVELPSWANQYEKIEWDGDIGDWVGYTTKRRKNPPIIVEEPERGVAINTITGREEPL